MSKKNIQPDAEAEVKIEIQTDVEKLKLELSTLKTEILAMHVLAKEMKGYVDNISNRITKIDRTYLNDLSKLYGFNGENMYYVGAGSGRVYRKPVDTKIVGLISRFGTLNEDEVREVNKHFMG